MDKKEFEQKIRALAEVKQNAEARDYRATDIAGHPLVAVRLRLEKRPCDVCAKVVEGGPERIYYKRDGKWAEKCATCARYKHPVTGQWVNSKRGPVKKDAAQQDSNDG